MCALSLKEVAMSRTISWIFVLLVVAAFLGAPAAYGQVAMNCTASVPVQASIRAEGLTELVGDIIITCTGGTPVASGPYPTITLNIYMSALVTSRVLVSATPPLLETLLLIDDPAPASQVPCVAATCNNTDNVHQGRLPQFNSVSFSGIPINPPGPNAQRTVRVKNLRVNASLQPTGSQVIASLILTGTNVNPLNSAQQVVANVRQALSMEMRSITDTTLASALTLVACTGNNIDLANNSSAAYGTPGGRTFHLRFSEASGFPDAWRRRNVATSLANPGNLGAQESPSLTYTTETGFYNPNFADTNGLRRAGLADQGTRLRAVFSSIPNNIKVFVTTREVTPGTTVSGTNPTVRAVLTGTGSFSPMAPESQADGGLKLVQAGQEIVWEILDTDVAQVETVSFGVVLAYTGSPQPGAGTATVVGGFGPQSISPGATFADPIPRFNVPMAAVNVFTMNACRTSLLFQFVTNQAGFDTGVAVTNTSKDTLGTLAQTGRCIATFFPTPVGNQSQYPVLNSPSVINAGEQWVFSISNSRPGFQGYMMVGCDFQFAHGYAFISDFGAQKLAQGYQALVIPDRPRVADPVTTAGAGSGEQLIH